MKKITRLLALMAIGSLTFVACKKDKEVPTMTELTVAADNATATLTFSEAVFGADNGEGNIEAADFEVTVTGNDDVVLSSYTITHSASNSSMTINLTLAGYPDGTETLTVKPKSATAVYDEKGNALEVAEKTATLNKVSTPGIIGEWQSSGSNVAVLLATYFNVDSIWAKFKYDFSYEVKSYDVDGVETKYTGTFTQTASGTNDIWNIVLSQSTPSVGKSEGIFKIYAGTPDNMDYEVVQTEPSINAVPPTAAGGFGSTNGGALGSFNIQKYVRLK